jgi:RHS repeat-associated protein
MQLTSGVEIPDGLLAAMPQLAENSRQGFEQITGTMHWASGFVISHTSLGISGPLYDTRTESRYTGKERDTESGLDYFGARYYASNMGRWMSPDWSAKQEPVPYSKLDNPQSLNLYAYVYNNPLSKADPDGHDTCGSSNGGVCDATQHAPTDGHVHAWDVAGGTMAAGALYMSGRGLIAGASSLWGVGSRAAMSAYLGLSVLGTQGAQNLMSARDSVSSSLGAIRDAAASGEISLPGGTANLLKSAGNAVSNSFTNSDINGAIKQSVTGIEAGGDHVQELQGVANSLTNLSGRLSTALANPTLSDQTRTLYQNAVKAIQPAVDQINKLKQ